jgi:hypothetical protein
MDLTPYIDSLREDLATTASAGDEQTRRAAAVLSAALEPALRLAFMNALSDVAAEVTAALDDHVVEVKLAGREAHVVVTPTRAKSDPEPEQQPFAAPPPPPGGENSAENISRMTLRMFEQIKSQAEQAAAAQGVSLNTFVSQAVQGALRRKWSGHQHQHQHRHDDDGNGSSRVHGWTEGS